MNCPKLLILSELFSKCKINGLISKVVLAIKSIRYKLHDSVDTSWPTSENYSPPDKVLWSLPSLPNAGREARRLTAAVPSSGWA